MMKTSFCVFKVQKVTRLEIVFQLVYCSKLYEGSAMSDRQVDILLRSPRRTLLMESPLFTVHVRTGIVL